MGTEKYNTMQEELQLHQHIQFLHYKPKSQRLFYISRLGRGPRCPAPLLTLQNVTAETPETQMTLLNLLQLRVELIQDFWMCASLFQQADGKSSE